MASEVSPQSSTTEKCGDERRRCARRSRFRSLSWFGQNQEIKADAGERSTPVTEPEIIDITWLCRMLRPFETSNYILIYLIIQYLPLLAGIIGVYFLVGPILTVRVLLIFTLAVGAATACWLCIGKPEVAVRQIGFAGPAIALVLWQVLWQLNLVKDLNAPVIATLAIACLVGIRWVRVGSSRRKLVWVLHALRMYRKSHGSAMSLRPRGPVRGAVFLTLSVLLLFGFPLLSIYISEFRRASSSSLPTVIGLMFGMVYVAPLGLFFARSFFQPDADAVLKADNRPPILVLRSFRDDAGLHVAESFRPLFDFSLEARLANHFARLGPFIAVGSPRQKIMPIGARRFQLSDEEWQDAIQRWLDEAQIIIYIAGITHWALWELSQVVAKGFAHKLIIVFPEAGFWVRAKLSAAVEERMTAIREAFAGTIWEKGLAGAGPSGSIRSISFQPSGRVMVVTSRAKGRTSYQFAALIAHYFMIER
jgi:hypothetical protein